MAAPFDAAQVDDFNRTEQPISDSGKWFSPCITGVNDYSKTMGGGIKWALHYNDNILAPGGSGYGVAIRTGTPGVLTDSQVYARSNGVGNGNRLILRADSTGRNFYAVRFGSTSGTWDIEKWVGGAPYIIAARTRSEFFPGVASEAWCGLRVIGTQIQVWSGGFDLSGGWGTAPVLTATDSAYPSGYLGFAEQGILNVLENGIFGGSDTHGTTGSDNLFTPPILIPYEKYVTRHN